MKKTFKILAVVLCAALLMGIGAMVTFALLQDSDESVNVMTLGNVYIEQIEEERDANGKRVPFTQAKPLLPAWYEGTSIPYAAESEWPGEGEAWKVVEDNENVIDKFVTVKNTGKSDAYVRTIIAFEGDPISGPDIHVVHNDNNSTNADVAAQFEDVQYIENVVINDVRYDVIVYTYANPLAAGETTIPSLKQVYLDVTTGNEQVEAFGETYDIMVLSQAVQTKGFASASKALEAGFGVADAANVQGWFTGIQIPGVFAWEGVNYITDGDTASVNANGGDTIYRGVLSDGKTSVTSVDVNEGITRLNNRCFAKSPTIAEVNLPSTLTYIDESAFQQSGITSIEVPENVTYIGKQAFGACGSLETIVINAKNVTIANYVARACANLKEVYIYSESVTFESGSMYFTNKENADASAITFYVANQDVADTLYSAFSTSHSYGLLIKSLDNTTTFYNTLK